MKQGSTIIDCSHARIFREALAHELNADSRASRRIIGLFANTAALEPEELDDAAELISEEPAVFGKEVADLHRDLGLSVLGGCCGTDARHIRELAIQLRSQLVSS